MKVINISKIDFSKPDKKNKSYSLDEDIIETIEKLANRDKRKDSQILNDILRLTFELNQ